MAASNASRIFLLSHFKSVLYTLQAAGAGYKTAAKCHVAGKHVLNTAISIFYIFTNYGNIYGYTSLAKNGVYARQGLKSPLIGISVPCFTGRNIYAFYTLAFGCF